MIIPIIIFGKIIYFLSRTFNIGSGGTWPGEIALWLDKRILISFCRQIKKGIIIVSGTNGKTTTAKLISHILLSHYKKTRIIHNDSGANLINGLVSVFIKT